MILNRKFYTKISSIRALWARRQYRKLSGEKLFRVFRLHNTIWPEQLYFYSTRLKRIPKFTGNKELLKEWKFRKVCEDLCPTNAIRVTDSEIIIDDRGCITCGLCVELAPPGLLEYSENSTILRDH